MAQRTITQYIDDITGKEGDDINTHVFSLDGSGWEIDLNAANHDKLLKALKPFMEKGRRVKKFRTSIAPARTRSTANSHGNQAEIREWARKNGHEINARGRIPASIVEAFEQANS